MECITLEKKVMSTNDWGLIALLHEGLMERFEESSQAIEEKNNDKLSILINNSRDILTELLVTFREKDELSTNLRSLYLYTNKLITEAQIKKDPTFFRKAIDVINPIYIGFKGLELKEEPNIVSGLTYGKGILEEHNIKSGKIFQG
ncbi:flagellar protein FliS [Tissierella carlieri]|uniref:Flagellar protein FliS n=1 Tax=Tissierella carlieri TaxID=689904 RepID=A0ABT1S7N8_9FIRM|nr:flagellar protein FliS [Tissierella carlieri]MBU5312709.1 flagellar protein FliS [Tissierella carlieri]MCQ4922479.1 flagellar protein FliS [Tissierella carlieri]